MLERFLDILVVKPDVDNAVKALREEGFAIACSTGLKNGGTFRSPQREKWWEDVWIYDTEILHYESRLPPHRRAFLTDESPAPLNKEPFNETPVARILVSRARLDKRGVVIGSTKLGRPEIHLTDAYFDNDPQMLERLQRAANKASVPCNVPNKSD